MEDRARALAARLAASGALRTPRWVRAFETVPRHAFVPKVFTDPRHSGAWELVDGTDPGQRDRWLGLVYSDTVLVTRLGDGGTPLSSSSQPSLMARMLEALDFNGGERVLEVGTGTGYNAALLCAGLGSELVTSIDIDAGLVSAARERLAERGYTPTLTAGDGADGFAGTAPYDRIIATCALPRIPPAWLSQAAPGALIVVNLHREIGGGALALLRVSGGQASGHFASFSGGFMPTRTIATVPLAEAFELITPYLKEPGDRRPTAVPVGALGDDAFDMLAALLLPGVRRIGLQRPGGQAQTWLVADDGAWACQEGPDVRQGGPRRLWDELETLHRQWTACGCPPRDAIGLTVTATGAHRLWAGPGHEQEWTI